MPFDPRLVHQIVPVVPDLEDTLRSERFPETVEPPLPREGGASISAILWILGALGILFVAICGAFGWT